MKVNYFEVIVDRFNQISADMLLQIKKKKGDK